MAPEAGERRRRIGWHDLPRAASFRMALLFMGLYGAIAALLFCFLYMEISGFALERIDDWLPRERNAMLRGPPEELPVRVVDHARLDPQNERPFGLFGRDGKRLAGTYPGPPPGAGRDDKPMTVSMLEHGSERQLRVAAYLLPDFGMLVLSQDLAEVNAFDALLRRALASAAAIAMLLGLAGAVLIGRRAAARLDTILAAIETIVSGDFSQRLPRQPARWGKHASTSDDLDRLVGVVNTMLDDIERLMHEVKGACDNIAHDLRTPLARLLAGLERAQRRGGSSADYHAAVEAAIADTLSLLNTFNAILRISEIEDGARRAGFTDVDLAAIAGDAVEFYEPAAENKQIVLEYRRAAALPVRMRGDASLLFEALGNVIDNAIKFSPAGSTITVSVDADAATGACTIEVADRGPGIPPSEREAVFRRFHRVEDSRHLPGNGLGLSMVAAVARLHGLGITIGDQDDGVGCRVALIRKALPR